MICPVPQINLEIFTLISTNIYILYMCKCGRKVNLCQVNVFPLGGAMQPAPFYFFQAHQYMSNVRLNFPYTQCRHVGKNLYKYVCKHCLGL